MNFRLANARACLCVPHHCVTIRVRFAVAANIATALADVEVPEVVVRTEALDADACSSKCVEFFKLVVAFS